MKFVHAYGQVLLQLRAKQKPPSTVKLLQILQQLPLFLAMQSSNYLLDNDLFLFAGTNRSVLGKRQKHPPWSQGYNQTFRVCIFLYRAPIMPEVF
jgi:hypothetical protein